MKYLYRSLAFLLLSGGILFIASCKRAPIPRDNKGDKDNHASKKDPFNTVVESFRYNPGSGDDWTRFRDGVKLLDSHFTKPEVIRLMSLPAAERKFLGTEGHLSPEEFAEVESTSFRKADAHYLDECFLLRDAFRALEVTNSEPVDQAHFLFRWVMRNVMLHEQVDDWLPPAFTLRRGYGSAVDRALLYLALMRQTKTEGCLIVVPDAEPKTFLVGIREAKTSNVRLFDPRLGLAVVGKDGKSVATLAEAQADPALLAPSGITPEQAKKLEAWLVCPLFALSPRMMELQRGVNPYEPVVLHLNAPALADDIAKATKLQVKVWNPPVQGKTIANSPTRALWMFLPQREGGIDNGQRLADYAQSRIPTIQVIANWAPFKITEGLLSRPAWMSLLRLNDDLFNKYDIQPREMYLRGHRDAMVRRLDRMELFVDSPALTGLERDALEIVDWLNKVNTAFAAIQFDDPKQQGSAQKAMAAMFGDDTFVGRLIQVDKDEQFNREAKGQEQVKRGVMTKILAIGSRDYFAAELARLRASANHELAERSQATADAAKSMNASRNRADEAWGNAKSAWANYYLVTSLSGKIDRGVQQIHRWQDLERLGVRLGLLEALHLDVHKYFQAKIRLAECKLHADTNGAKSAASYLEETRREIEAMESKAFLKSEVEALTQSLRQFPKGEEPLRTRLQRRVDLLATDWSATGNYHWLNKQIDRRIALQK